MERKLRNRVMVQVQCKKCGERFKLRGNLTPGGSIETGMKMCLCGNEDLEITPMEP